jgi:hypothetical protein
MLDVAATLQTAQPTHVKEHPDGLGSFIGTRLDRCYTNTECFHWVAGLETVNSRPCKFDHHLMCLTLEPPLPIADQRPPKPAGMRHDVLKTDESEQAVRKYLKKGSRILTENKVHATS